MMKKKLYINSPGIKMRRGRACGLMAGLIVCALGALFPAPTVFAATHLSLTVTPESFPDCAPLGPTDIYYAEDTTTNPTTSWFISYNGSPPANGRVDVTATPTSNFVDSSTGANFPASQLAFWDSFGGGTSYVPLQNGVNTPVCSKIVTRHATEPVTFYMQLRLTGTEAPGSYTINLNITASEIP